ncbi:acyl-CoA synthetase [Alcaligenaceae bacterium LF4-65]|uniref:Acyl-CoA synthetase n=1 Tax=Zwartia hollandica TaxID=324606 RepID=A0A953N7K6_9BURK|nr:acyl-CoA synthetase [Zwartia hollandica]MBZ1350065.1 acyl-CoA synthetase [Zwartia hollandica]
MNIYEQDLPKTAANYTALTPVDFIVRAAEVFPNRLAVIHGPIRRTWAQTYQRCMQLAQALRALGVQKGDTVTAMLANTPEMIESHFGVPAIGAVLNALNTRLDAASLTYMLNHAQAKVVLVDREFAKVMQEAIAHAQVKPIVIDIDDTQYQGSGDRIGTYEYEALLAAQVERAAQEPIHFTGDEWDAIALNYTSGTTGEPKGVVYSHRGAQLAAISNILEWDLPSHVVYLWTLPMFHCNGWTYPWAIAARAGVNVCLRKVTPEGVFGAIRDYNVSHFCGAPIVHSMLVNAPEALKKDGMSKLNGRRVQAMVAGAAPSATLIESMEALGITLTHVYGLTEVYGPCTVCSPQEGWDTLPVAERAVFNARQGVRYHLQAGADVLNPETMQPVPRDGETIGEIVLRGNIGMKGYLRNAKATEAAFAGGWFHTGDLGVRFPDGYIKIKDRSKDVIISGGENISSIEIEDVLYKHPAIMAVAVVAKPHPKWGETPCAFIELKPSAQVSAEDLIKHCKQHLAGFKVPGAIEFGELPKTSTGKIQKFELRKRSGAVNAIDV